ncbi:MAG: endolytic transglycosylase MltG [Paracoccaceae bacterium]|nr:endolytic transglycosylase MltG [Paracoccaceae bacterium]
MWRSAASNLLTFMGLALLLLGGLVVWGKSTYSGAGPLAEAICLRIDRGSNMRVLSQSLEGRGAVSNAALFRIGVEYQDRTEQLKAGSFLIPKSVSMVQIADIVTRGGANTCGTEIVYRIGINKTMVQIRELDPATETLVERANFQQGEDAPEVFTDVNARSGTRHRIALAEGVTSWQVVQSLSEIETLAGNLVDIPEEGSIAPESYEVRQGEGRQSVLNRMMAAQEAILIEAWETRAEDLPLTAPQEALILASIIEKETALAAERDQVASVFVNRLKRGIALQTDPTVIYGLTEGKAALGRGLRRSELKKDTPWNTYLYRGLPPTPIANPGRDSIRAALNPADTKFLYFVADGQGGHAFATNLKDHNKNVAKWRAIEAERKKN